MTRQLDQNGKDKNTKMNKNKRAQHRNLKKKHPDSKWKSGGGSPGNFLKKKQSEANVRRLKTKHVGRFKH